MSDLIFVSVLSRGPAGQRPLCPVHRPEHAGPVSVTSLSTRGASTAPQHRWRANRNLHLSTLQINQFPPSPRQRHHPGAALGGGQHARAVQWQLFTQHLFQFLQRYAWLDTHTHTQFLCSFFQAKTQTVRLCSGRRLSVRRHV